MSKDIAIAELIEAVIGDPVNPPQDTHTEVGVIKSIVRGDKWWTIETEDSGFTITADRLDHRQRLAFHPKVGDEIVLYLTNMTLHIGLDLNGERIFLESEREVFASWLHYRARHARFQATRAPA